MRLTVACLLLAYAVALSSSATVIENGMPILWGHTGTQLTDLPIENGVVNPDPWHFLHRLTLYRLMIAATDPYMGTMGPNPTDSPMWGLPLELAWMLTSGRLADPTAETTCGHQTGDTMCISTKSFWGCANYFVSAMPFLSAAQQGLMGPEIQVQLQIPVGVQDYCTTYADCSASFPDAMSKWDAFFKDLVTPADPTLPENERKDAVLGLFWAAQSSSIRSSSGCNARRNLFSSTELSFSNSWLNSAEYVAAARFQSNLENSVRFITPLPSRILLEGDVAPNIPDLSETENHILQIFNWMQSIDSLLAGRLVPTWQNAMCSVRTREEGRKMLENLLLDSTYATSSFLSIVTGMALSC
ncbi:protein LEG1 homolog [Cynoglossus semilaevis]|uniref:Protein LEG1 homolog n=1 Tax=Cynoglossus semilaevis TaxID=244447 RepID=A0A3P8WXN5_CYNSE|nr:protein LEG1 homolog [Cynoglossus semilaevis]